MRRNTSKAALYESIMRKVSKVLKQAINESKQKVSLIKFMKEWYDNDDSCEDALDQLNDGVFVKNMGWINVFHEGIGDGIASPSEGVVAVFDQDDLPDYHDVYFYEYDTNA